MNLEQQVTVYNFLTFERGYESARKSTFKATRKAIVEIFGGEPVEGTAQAIDPDEIDAMGRYQRQPTGWGELN